MKKSVNYLNSIETYNTKTVQMALSLLLANEPNATSGQKHIFLKYGVVEIGETIHTHNPYNLIQTNLN